MKRQRGVALLAAVLVVALATVLVAALFDLGEASRAHSRNALRAEQTWQLLHGLEGWAAKALRDDEAEASGIDSASDRWAQPLPPLAVPGGMLQGRLLDRSGCFNLNRLHVGGSDDAVAIARFERLLRALRLDPTIAAQAADWIDADHTPRAGGAEDLNYRQQRPAHRAGNLPFVHVSELRLLPAVDAEAYARLAPEVCALPPEVPANLNFASPALWMSLDERLSEAAARRLWRDGRARYPSLDAVLQALRQEGVELPGLDGFDVASRYFLLEAEILSDGVPFAYASLLRRGPRGVEVLARVRGRL